MLEFISLILNRRNVATKSVFLKELDDLLGSEYFAADWAKLVWKSGQAFEAGAMAALQSAFLSLVAVVLFQADVTLVAIVFWLIFKSNLNTIKREKFYYLDREVHWQF